MRGTRATVGLHPAALQLAGLAQARVRAALLSLLSILEHEDPALASWSFQRDAGEA